MSSKPLKIPSLDVVIGYLRILENTTNISIPDEIKNIIIIYIKTYILFGNGENRDGQLGFKKTSSFKENEWKRLNDFEKLINNPNDIYCNGLSIMVKYSDNLLYGAGDNSHKWTNWYWIIKDIHSKY